MKTRYLHAIAMLLGLAGTGVANAAVIDFGAFATGSFSGGSEDGFAITATSANIWYTPFSNNSLGVASPTTTATATLTTTGLFEFGSLDFAVRDASTPGLTVEGFLGASSVGIDSFAAPVAFDTLFSFSALNLAGVKIDRLLLTFTSSSSNSPRIDNIVLSTSVPEPGTVILMGIALAGIGLGRRNKKRN